ncbi:MAG: putative selenate ABC transporter substrate-binding protein [Planctomycetota bacterium]
MAKWLPVFLLALFAVLPLAACSSEEPEEKVLSFSAIPDEKDATKFEEKFGKVAAYLEKQLGVKVKYVHATTYADSVEQFKNGNIQMAWFGGLTGVQAVKAVPGARAIAYGKEDPNYFSYFIANAATGLERGDDYPAAIKGKKFTFGSAQSTSGRLMPESFIRANNGDVDPKDYFGGLNFSGSHDKTCELVAAGEWEVGAVSYTTYDKLVKDGKLDPKVCKVIWKSPTYADYNFTAHPMLEEMFGKGFVDKLQKALIDMKDPELLAAIGRSGLIKASNADFKKIEETAAKLGFLD